MADEITVIGIGVDTTQVNKAATDLDKLAAAGARTETAVDGIGASLSKVGTAAAGASRGVSAIGAASGQAASGLEKTGTAASVLAGAISKVEASAGGAAKEFTAVAQTSQTAAAALTSQASANAALATVSDRASAALKSYEDASVKSVAAQAALSRATLAAAQAQAQLNALLDVGPQRQESIAAASVKAQSAQAALAGATLAASRAQAEAVRTSASFQSAIGKTGEAMKLTANQSTQLGFQLQDFFVQVQAGQSPLTALIQQGSQLQGTFGSIGGVFRALGTVFTPVRLAVGGVVGALAGLGLAYKAGADESIALERSLILTGNAAGITEGKFNSLAQSVAESTKTGIGSARETLQGLVSSGQLSGDTLTKVFTAVQAGSKATGQSTEDLAKQFVGALDNVGGFAEKLNRTYNVLSADQLKLIKETADNGDAQKALGLVMDALNPKFAEAAGKAGFLERAFASVSNQASALKDELLALGRATTPEESLRKVQGQIAELQKSGQSGYVFGPSVAELKVQEQSLKEQVNAQNAIAAAGAKVAQQEQAKTKFSEIQNANLSKQEKFAKEIANANAIADKAGISGSEREKVLKSIADKYRDVGSAAKTAQSAFADLTREFDGQLEVMKARIANGTELSKSQELEIRLSQKLAENVGKLSKAELERLRAKAQELVAAQKQIEANATELKAAEQIAAARAEMRRSEEKAIADTISQQEKERESSLKSVTDRLQSLKDEETAVALSRAQNLSLAEAVELVALARLQEQQSRFTEDSPQFAAIQKEINARKELASLIGSQQAREANEKAAKEAADAWQKASDQIGQSLTDALMNGGKSALEYIKGLFRSTVLRPIIQGVVNPIAGAITGSLGLPGAASASSGAGSILGAGQNLFSSISGGLTSSLASIVGSAGSLFGSTALTTFATGIKGANLAAGLAGPTTAGAGGLLGAGASFASAVPYLAGALALFSAKDALFGRKLKDTSISGTFGGDDGFSGSTEKFFKGGLFRSNKTETTALSAEVASPIAEAAKAVRDQITGYAEALNLPVDAIAGFTESIKFSTKDLTPEQIQKKLEEALQGFGDKLAGTLASQVDPFAKAGETTGQTLARLGDALKTVNPIIGELGFNLFDIGVQGADAASQLADLFGGSNGLAQAASSFYEKFYSETERAAKTTEQVTEALAGVGVKLPDTREAFRAIVEAQDLTTESGRKTFATLLGVSDAFDSLIPPVEDVGEAAKKAADDLAALEKGLGDAIRANIGKFQTPNQRTETAINDIGASLSAVGVNIDFDTLIGASKAQIYAFAESFVNAADNSIEAKTAVVNAAGALADLKDAADDTAQGIKDAAEALRTQLQGAIDANVDKFLSPEQRTNRAASRISDNLSAVGISVDVGTLLGATKEQIFEFARSFVLAGENSDEAKLAVVEAAGALADIADAATIAARDLQTAEIQKQIDDIAKAFGDLTVINEPIKSLSDQFVEARDKAKGLEDGLAQLIGNSARTIQQTLADLLSSQKALQGYRASLASSIEDARLRTLSPEQRVASLRSTEQSLFSQLQTAEDPVAVAQKLTAVTLQRIKEEAGLQSKANDAAVESLQLQVALEQKIRDSQMAALREQIGGFEALRDLAKDMAQFTGSLKFGDLSPLSADRQLAEAKSLFESTVEQAKAGDANAVGNVQGNAQALLEEARSYFGGSTAAFSSIFSDVIGELDALGVAGANVDPQIAALELQAQKLEALNATTTQVVDTSQQELAALLAIDSALATRESTNAEKIEKQVTLAEQQVAESKAQTEIMKAQVEQQAAIVESLEAKLQEVIDIAQAQLDNTTLEAARP